MGNDLNHIDLFTGIGGFALACQWNGIHTEVMVEKDERCRQFLKKAWPGIPIVHDIRDFDGRKWRGKFLFTGGVPCQPASRAGNQRGARDDRWLWAQALRIVGEANPCWCLFENPPGIYDVGIDGILFEMESLGYETGIVEIPACAVNSPQIRQRVWILANRNGARCGQLRGAVADEKKHNAAKCASESNVADTEKNNIGTGLCEAEKGGIGGRRFGDNFRGEWGNFEWVPCADGKFRRSPHYFFGLVDGLHRSILEALGNSIVPKVAFEIIKAIKQVSIDEKKGGKNECIDATT